MVLKEPFMGKHVTLSVSQNFELEADTGEAFMVKDIHVYNPANNYVKVLVDKVTVGYFRVGGDLGNHLPFLSMKNKHSHGLDVGSLSTADDVTSFQRAELKTASGNVAGQFLLGDANYDWVDVDEFVQHNAQGINVRETVLGYLARLGLFKGFPIAEGQKMVIMEDGSSTQQADVYVEYEKYEPGDITPEMPNGSEAKEYMFLNYGRPSSALAVDTTTEINTMISPAEFPKFPFEEGVPAKTDIEIQAILASPVSVAGNGSNYGIRTKYLKLQRGREVLFDEDRNGLLFWQTDYGQVANDLRVGGGMTVVGNKSDVDARDGFDRLRGRLFRSGEDLDIYITTGHIGSTEGTPKTISVSRAEICLVERVIKTE